MSYPSDGQHPRAYSGDGAPRDFQRRRQPQGEQPRGSHPPHGGHPSQAGYQDGGQPHGHDDYAPNSYREQGRGGYRPQAVHGGGYSGQGGYTDQSNDGAQGGYAMNDGYGGRAYGSAAGRGPRGGEPATQVIGAADEFGLPDEDDDDTAGGGKRRLKTENDKKARRKKIRKILLICLAVLVLLVGGGTFAGWRYLQSVEDKVTKVDAFDPVELPEAERPAVVSTKAMNILILGTDTRDPDATGSRTDTIMIAHVTQDHKAAQIVSIPRDSWVDIPKTADGKRGGTKGKINWAFAWGGIPLMVRTVESVSKVRIDHVILIDFAGFQGIVDAVGGIDIDNDVTFTSFFWENNHHVFKKGRLHLDGNLALDYARQRKMLANGDFDRIKHQQMVVKAVMDKATSKGVIADPGKLTAFLNSVAKTITTDKKFDMLSTAMALRDIGSKDVKFLTAPTKGTGRVGDQSVVFYDFEKSASLFTALTHDQAASWRP